MNVDGFSSMAVRPGTHPAHYAFHKYWARKPHEVVRRALELAGVGPGTVVLDPCCGSGVPLGEAARLGARCVGIDANPVAALLTRTTLDPPSHEALRREMITILEDAKERFAEELSLDGQPVRHVVHATIVRCPGCGKCRTSLEASRARGRWRCADCGARLSFNLEHLVGTVALHAVLQDGTRRELGIELCESTERGGSHDFEFAANDRVLAHRGMSTRRLFTPRNFRILTFLAERVAEVPEAIRAAASLTLTAAVAQCSRLIPFRGALSSGGPAWTVPGYWVAPVHLEGNPLSHLRARIERTVRGLRGLAEEPGRGPCHEVIEGDAIAVLEDGVASGSIDVAFVDPPYGDTLPYLECSALWNSFLGRVPDPGLDLSASDGTAHVDRWRRYAVGLASLARSVRRSLRPDGRVIVTFNSRDLRAWKALVSALHGAGLQCAGAFHQEPVVVSAKAQLARGGSCVGDVYSLYLPIGADASPDVERSTASHSDQPPERPPSERASKPPPFAPEVLVKLLRTNVPADGIEAALGLER